MMTYNMMSFCLQHLHNNRIINGKKGRTIMTTAIKRYRGININDNNANWKKNIIIKQRSSRIGAKRSSSKSTTKDLSSANPYIKYSSYAPPIVASFLVWNFWLEEKDRDLYRAMLEASGRAARLVKTTAKLIFYYKIEPNIMYPFVVVSDNEDELLNKEDEILLEDAAGKLHDAQKQQEKVGILLQDALEQKNGITVGAEKLEELQSNADQARFEVEKYADVYAKVEEKLTNSTKKHNAHLKASKELLDLCQKNAGVYIKIGQHLAQLDYLLPQEFLDSLKVLLNQAPTSDYENVRQVVFEDFGKYPEEMWDSFEKESIASASLAQVHIAYSKGLEKKKLAIKIQHRGLRETSKGDMKWVCLLVDFVSYVFPDFKYKWIAEEMAPQLPKELDFINEGKNAERAAFDLRDRKNVIIPKIIWEMTSSRVLTMEFETGCNATDVKGIKEQGLKLPDVAELISSVFCDQIFKHGFIHADPHPGNVLIRANKNKKLELVLVDHGLYKEIDDEFRLNYCNLWKNLVEGNVSGIKKCCLALNSGDLYPLLSSILTSRPWDDIKDPSLGSLHTPNTQKDKIMLRGYAQMYLNEISEVLDRVPRKMLLLFKTNDCLRHIDRALGAPVNTSLVTFRTTLEVIYKEEKQSFKEITNTSTRYQKYITAWAKYTSTKFAISFYEFFKN